MGIKDLNKLFTADDRVFNAGYRYTIIDGSNMVFMVLTGIHGMLKTSNPIPQWPDAIALDLFEQTKIIITRAVERIIRSVSYYVRMSEKVYFVMDPTESPIYTITPEMMFNKKYINEIPGSENFAEYGATRINLKAEEQAARQTASSKSANVERKQQEFAQFKQYGFTDDHINLLFQIFRQAYLYADSKYLIKLAWYVIAKVQLYFAAEYPDQDFFNVIKATDEADMVIKCLGAKLSASGRVLVLSADTDYCVLFADCPEVDVGPLNKSERGIINPYAAWKRILGDLWSLELVYRIPPLLGNDYTIKKSCVTVERFDDFIDLLTNFRVAHTNARRVIYRLAKPRASLYPTDNPLTPEQLDDLVYHYDRQYFQKYFLSTIVYTNWQGFGKYELLPPSQDPEHLLREALEKIVSETSVNIYAAPHQHLYTNWTEYFTGITCVELNTSDDIYNYYLSITLQEDHNDPVPEVDLTGDDLSGWC